VRITGGIWRSRRLKGPGKIKNLRPTPDAMRERCFAVLGDRVDGARVLDLFAGTGAVGLEALSRGASSAVFVEPHRSAARLITANIESLAPGPDRASVVVQPAAAALTTLSGRRLLFDLVWADPPFEIWGEGLEILNAVIDASVVTDNATLCLECPVKADIVAGLSTSLFIERDLVGGASRVVILRRR
jgi:16S rRNA (guanine(966)-N(2))-methyltransferase RsmD